MKRLSKGWKRGLFLAILVLVVGRVWSQAATGPAGAPLGSDVNGDGQVTVADAQLALEVAVGVIKPADIPRPGLPGTTANPAQVQYGRYLVLSSSCVECHNRGTDNPNDPNWLAGYIQNAQTNPQDQGVFAIGPFKTYASNLTPDPDTGLGKWTAQDIFNALRNGKDPEGQFLCPPMPWPSFREKSDDDLWAIAAYLKSIKPVKNAVPESQGPGTPGQHGDWSGSYTNLPPPFQPYPGTNETP